MEKLLGRLSIWLCCLCAVLAIITRVMTAFGLPAAIFQSRMNPIDYHTFMDGVLLFTMLSLVAACFSYVNRNGA